MIQSADTHHNALYTSKTIQNELIVACGHIIHTSILKDIKAAHLFSVMADEATGVANDEQLSISLCYVKHDMRTMAFSECVTRVSGESIAEVSWQVRRKEWQRALLSSSQRLYTPNALLMFSTCVVKCCSIT